MTHRYTFVAGFLTVLSGSIAAAEPAPLLKDTREAVVRALPLIQKGSAGHMAQRTCFACHHQGIPVLAMSTARAHGVAVPDDQIQKHLKFIADFLDKNRANYLKGKGQGGQVDTAGYALLTLEMGGWKADAT